MSCGRTLRREAAGGFRPAQNLFYIGKKAFHGVIRLDGYFMTKRLERDRGPAALL